MDVAYEASNPDKFYLSKTMISQGLGCNQPLAWHTIAAPEKGYTTVLVTNTKACRLVTSCRPSPQCVG
jgi:hypothetical protein